MIIRRVELNNVVSHRLTVVEFPHGVTAIVGRNGAGKTSIIDGITYAVFGTHSRGTRRKDRAPLIRLGAAEARITLEFSTDGNTYRIIRRVPRSGSTTALLYRVEDGGRLRLLAQGVKPVEAELKRIFGMDLDLAQRLYVTRQGELDDIVVDKEKREKLITSVLRLKEFETAAELLSRVRSTLRVKRDALAERLRDHEARLDQLLRLQREAEEARKRLREIEPVLQEMDEIVHGLEEELRKAEEAMREAEKAASRLEALTRQIEILQAELDKRRSELEEAVEAKRRLRELEPLLENLGQVEKAVQLLEEAERLRREAEKLAKEVEAIRSEASGAEELRRAREEYERLREERDRLEDQANEYRRVKTSLDTLEADLRRVRLERERLAKRIKARMNETLASGLEVEPSKALERLQALLEALERQIDRARERIEKLREKRGELEGKRRELGDNLDRLASAHGVCPLCRRPLTEEQRTRLIAELRQEKRRVEQELAEVEKRIALLEREVRELNERRQAIQRLIEELRSLVERVRFLDEEEARLEEKREELKQKYLQAYMAYKEYEEAKRRLQELEPLVRRLQELERRLAVAERLEREAEEKRSEARRREEEAAELLRAAGVESPGEAAERLEELKRLREEAEALRALASREPVLRESVESLKAELESLRGEAEELRPRAEALPELQSRVEELRAELEEKRRERDALAREEAELRGKLGHIERELEQLPVLRERVRELRSQYEALGRALDAAEKLRRLFADALPRAVQAKARSTIEYHLRDMLYRFNLDFVDVRLGDDYEPIVVSRDGEKTVTMLSGGERVALAIAYRLAVARALGGRLGVLIMDEPTVHLDEERKRELINIIRYGLEATRLQQMIIVTHDHELEEAADHVIEVVNENGVSRATPRPPGLGLGGGEAEPAVTA